MNPPTAHWSIKRSGNPAVVLALLVILLISSSSAQVPPSAVPEFLSIAGHSTGPLLTWSSVPGASGYILQVSTDPFFTQLVLNDSTITGTLRLLAQHDTLAGYCCRVAGMTAAGVTDWSATLKFLAEPGSDVFPLSEGAGWNLLSLPLRVTDTARNFIFPAGAGCKTPTIICYTGTYSCCADFFQSRSYGFWNRSLRRRLLALTGTPIVADTEDIAAGWNLVGSGFWPSAVSDVTSDPPRLITSRFFSYTHSAYEAADSLRPFEGYWVHATSAGRIILPPPPNQSGSIIAYVHWGNQPIVNKKIVLVETSDTVYTDTSGQVKFNLPGGKYTVRAFDINRGGPVRLSIDFDVDLLPGRTAIVDIIDCLPCL
jgi:hypothetical protein